MVIMGIPSEIRGCDDTKFLIIFIHRCRMFIEDVSFIHKVIPCAEVQVHTLFHFEDQFPLSAPLTHTV